MTPKENDIITIYNKGYNKTTYCSYGAYLKNWSNYGWKIIKL
jgi:hypothetical protein